MVFAATIFLSAFLLFQVQPLISKSILPWFGGTPAVWTTCMLFFQMVLFGGYVYAHLLSEKLQPRHQVFVHLGVVLAAMAFLPIVPATAWKPDGSEEPALRIVLLLAATVGLPFFVLSTTGPLLQQWYSHTSTRTSPYRLYALSNAGSLIALVTYPFAVEPALATKMQAGAWSVGFLVFGVLCALCASQIALAKQPVKRQAASAGDAMPGDGRTPDVLTKWLWFGLAMTASVMLLATTNQVCMDVASVPFLWVAPLTLYLLSFILCFDSERWYSRRVCFPGLAVSIAGVFWLLYKGGGASLVAQIGIYFAALFFAAMVCHGELVRLKPSPRDLTRFYLAVAAGGAAGGLFVAVVASHLFATFFEFQIGLVATCVLPAFVVIREKLPQQPATRNRRTPWMVTAAIACVIALPAAMKRDAAGGNDEVAVSRNFYGVLRVVETDRQDPSRHRFSMLHGRIVHGSQFAAPEKRSMPTAYYGQDSGVGLVLADRATRGSMHVGTVGLGVGTIAAYGQAGDRYRFYEINDDVIRLAEEHFTFLRDCPAEQEIVLGDARLSLEREAPQDFDVLVLDAFSGDAIPVHLLTVEAGEIYRRHLKPDGVLAIHISNMHFDLRPVVTALAEHLGMATVCTQTEGDPANGTETSRWMLLTPDPHVLQNESIAELSIPLGDSRILFTDDDSNLFEILRRPDPGESDLSTIAAAG